MFLGSLMSPSPQWHLPPDLADGAKNGTWVWLILPIFQSHLGCSVLGWVTSLRQGMANLTTWHHLRYSQLVHSCTLLQTPLPSTSVLPCSR